MSTAHRAADNLALLDAEDDRLGPTLDRLTEQDADHDTLCAGWSRRHVLTHLARNAEALGNLVNWAVDGREREAYASEQARRDDIEVGSQRSLEQIVADVRTTAQQFRAQAEGLRGPAGAAVVRSRTGNDVTGAQVVAMRTLEVVFHHVDLLAGYTFEDADPDWVARTLRRGVRTWEASGSAPALTLQPRGLDPMALGGGGPEVIGSPGAMLLWLARGNSDGLGAEVDLPAPPAWA